jgi:uncharacterized protein (TIGR04222 family)
MPDCFGCISIFHEAQKLNATSNHVSPNWQLWQDIVDYDIGAGAGSHIFLQRLARENSWDVAFARAAILEYKRFCYLQCSTDNALSPSRVVDQVWHLHLLYTRDYWRNFCPKVLRRDLHHQPAQGSAQEALGFREQYAQTLARYEAIFGTPNAIIWPNLQQRFANGDDWRWQNQSTPRAKKWRNWRLLRGHIVPGAPKQRMRSSALFLLALSLPKSAQARNLMDFSGGEFLLFYLCAMILGIFLLLLLRHVLTDAGTPPQVFAPEEIALLSGGSKRVLDALEVQLLSLGVLAHDAQGGRLFRTSTQISSAQQALANQIMALRNGTDAKARANLLDRYVEPIKRRLLAQQHLLPSAKRIQIALYSSVPLLLLLLVGIAKLLVGISRGKSVAFLAVLLILTGLLCALNFARRPSCSKATSAWLRHYKQQQMRLASSPTQSEWPQAVALFGFSALTGTALASYVSWRQPVSSSDATSSDSSSDSGGDSGGSDSGGGGCGGCGGGGGD